MHRALALLLLLASLGVSRAQASDFWDEVKQPGLRIHQRSLRASRTALRGGDPERALTLADRATEAMPERADGHLARGLALAAQQQNKRAAAAFQAALRRDRTALDSLRDGRAAAWSAARSGQLELASAVLRRLVSHLPDSPERRRLYALRGDVLMSLGPGHLHDAILSYRAALRSRGEAELTIRLGLGLAMHRQGEHEEAKRMVASLARRGRLEHGLARLPVPISERAARRALGLWALGDRRGATEAWGVVASMPGPWRDHARTALAELPHKGRP